MNLFDESHLSSHHKKTQVRTVSFIYFFGPIQGASSEDLVALVHLQQLEPRNARVFGERQIHPSLPRRDQSSFLGQQPA